MPTSSDNPIDGRPDQPNGDALLLRVGEVAALLGCSVRLVWRLRSEGLLPAVRLGPKSVRWRRETVVEYVESLREE